MDWGSFGSFWSRAGKGKDRGRVEEVKVNNSIRVKQVSKGEAAMWKCIGLGSLKAPLLENEVDILAPAWQSCVTA